jgi:hypothetical protein
MDYIAKAERETDPERKFHPLKATEDYGPGGRYPDCVGCVRLVNRPDLDAFKSYATCIQYLYDVTRKCNLLHIVGYSVSAPSTRLLYRSCRSSVTAAARCNMR